MMDTMRLDRRCIKKEYGMKASRKALLLGLMLAAGAGAAPPPIRVEPMPPPRVGYVWAPGFWEWRGHEHVWVAGRWVGERRGYHWIPDRWEQRGPHWHHERGHWER